MIYFVHGIIYIYNKKGVFKSGPAGRKESCYKKIDNLYNETYINFIYYCLNF